MDAWRSRDLTQFVNEYVWYLRGLMMLSASDQGEDMLDVSTERLAQMKEEATLADTETLIRYIRILSDLSGNLRFASQKRVLTEVAMIKLCKPQMDTEQDITTLKDRIANIEAQLEKVLLQHRSRRKVSRKRYRRRMRRLLRHQRSCQRQLEKMLKRCLADGETSVLCVIRSCAICLTSADRCRMMIDWYFSSQIR